jgi:hypothetical protein
MMKQEKTAVIISYWPLFDPRAHGYQAGDILLDAQSSAQSDAQSSAKPQDMSQLKHALSCLDDEAGQATACLWANYPFDNHPTTIIPVLVLDKAKDIVQHLKTWSDGDLVNWFKLLVYHRPTDRSRYCVILMPDTIRSVERYHLARELLHGEPRPSAAELKEWKYQVVFRPLSFGAASSLVYARLADTLSTLHMHLGIVDSSDIDVNNPGNLDHNKIEVLGPFKRGDPAPMLQYLDSFLTDLKPPKSGPSSWVNPSIFPT